MADYGWLVRRALTSDVLAADGDIIEVGAFRGEGTRMLAEKARDRKVYAVDTFTADSDLTVNTRGQQMAVIYRRVAGPCYLGAFRRNTAGLQNVQMVAGDSRSTVRMWPERACFAFIDGSHEPEVVRHDFMQCWSRLSPGGRIVCHDYGGDLPGVTAALVKCAGIVWDEVSHMQVNCDRWFLILTKKR